MSITYRVQAARNNPLSVVRSVQVRRVKNGIAMDWNMVCWKVYKAQHCPSVCWPDAGQKASAGDITPGCRYLRRHLTSVGRWGSSRISISTRRPAERATCRDCRGDFFRHVSHARSARRIADTTISSRQTSGRFDNRSRPARAEASGARRRINGTALDLPAEPGFDVRQTGRSNGLHRKWSPDKATRTFLAASAADIGVSGESGPLDSRNALFMWKWHLYAGREVRDAPGGTG